MTSKVRRLADGFSLLVLSPRLALMYRALKRPGRGGRMDRIQCGYFGFESEEQAQQFVTGIKRQFGEVRAAVRESDRLPNCAWEVKVWEFDGLLPLALQCAERSAA
ncbi:hypothetical protein H6F43_03495 [Leptolyngbya sp. FACHB-36]|uniref:hypothetical protein n=1 Tax=Leptolyngbya sp. FACHB-36 TaxID=2692808 RepID=UPI00167FEB30|nr:hypothetical protein [Leptolyngbya sp. FACHB-36]MBD2019246.1 hypothetical protein [Leptolyngbya sp. FACHB-36]